MRFALWIPALSMMLVSLISYVDRNTLALLAPTILRETGLSAEQYGWIISAFSVTYMIGNPVWGTMLDRMGVRSGMAFAVGFWTLASVSHAFAGGFLSFVAARAALGFGEGATFPGGMRTVMQTLPQHWRSRGIALAYSGGSLGAVATPLIVTPVAQVWGWRGAFWFTGLIGGLWLLSWAFLSRREDLQRKTVLSGANQKRPSFADPKLWSYIAVYALGGSPLAFVLYNSSLYLSQALGLTQAEVGKLLWIPPLGWEVGYFFWGWVMDRTGPSGYKNKFLLLTVINLQLATACWSGSVSLTMLQMFVAMFVAAGYIIVGVNYATSIFSTESSGFLAGLGAGTWSGAVAVLMPYFGRLFDQRAFDLAFALAAIPAVAGFAIFLLIDRVTSSSPQSATA